ncbi:MAG: DUF3124 domain-containing protein [Nitrospirota bacterium]
MRRYFLFIVFIFTVLSLAAGHAFPEVRLKKGQTVYVPVYSHVFTGEKGHPVNLAVTLALRNTDPKYPLTVTAVEYYDDHGKLVRRLISKPLELGPMASASFFIKAGDTTGGIGANFIVKWKAEREINAPVIESVMVRTGSGISFISPGQEIRD